MARYQLYYLRHGMLVGSGAIEAADEDEAASIARSADRSQTVEIWDDRQRLRVVTPPQAK